MVFQWFKDLLEIYTWKEFWMVMSVPIGIVGIWVLFYFFLTIPIGVIRFVTIWALILALTYGAITVDALRRNQQGSMQDSYTFSMVNKICTLRNGFYLLGILNLIDILQTVPFFPRFEANPLAKQYPYILFSYKILVFVILVPLVLPKIVEKYVANSEGVMTTILRFSLYSLVTLGNLTFIYVVISNAIAIVEILKIL